jgi:tetratricopeptide (TPR) repeat protein
VRSAGFLLLLLSYVFAGCAGTQTTVQVQAGRTALLAGDPATAVQYFSQAAQESPNYVNDASPLKEGVWTYLGRAQYALGQLPEARSSLTESLKRNERDFMARLYLGLTLLRLPPPPPPKADKTFSLQDISFALKEQVSPKRLAALVKERGVGFDFASDTDRELRKLGADDELIEQVRISANARKKPEPAPGIQGLRETERGFKESLAWLDGMQQAPQGRFWDPSKKIRSEIGRNLANIASRKFELRDLISGGEWVGKAMEEEVDLVRRDEREELNREQRR